MGKPEYMLTDEGTIVWLIEIQIDSSLFQAHFFKYISYPPRCRPRLCCTSPGMASGGMCPKWWDWGLIGIY